MHLILQYLRTRETCLRTLGEAGSMGRILILGSSAPLPLGAGLLITHRRNRKGHRAVLISPWVFLETSYTK